MSREIDTTDLDALSDEDLVYLHQRDRVEDYVLTDRGIDIVDYSKTSVPLEDRANTGTANTAGLTKEQYERRIAELEGQLEEALADEDDDEVDDRPYAERNNDELREELARRELEVSGNKAELIARLTADDEERGEDDEDDDEETSEGA